MGQNKEPNWIAWVGELNFITPSYATVFHTELKWCECVSNTYCIWCISSEKFRIGLSIDHQLNCNLKMYHKLEHAKTMGFKRQMKIILKVGDGHWAKSEQKNNKKPWPFLADVDLIAQPLPLRCCGVAVPGHTLYGRQSKFRCYWLLELKMAQSVYVWIFACMCTYVRCICGVRVEVFIDSVENDGLSNFSMNVVVFLYS